MNRCSDLDYLPPPRRFGFCPARDIAGTRYQCGGGAKTSSSQSQQANTTDNRIAVSGADGLVISQGTLHDLTLNSLDAGVATAGLDAATKLGKDTNATALALGAGALKGLATYIDGQDNFVARALAAGENQARANLQAVETLSANSNQIAAAVAKSQEQFVATASGQKTDKTALVVAGGVLALGALAFALSNHRK